MYALFIDTHSSLITVGLINKDNCFINEYEGNNSHSQFLLTMIKNILDDNNCKKEDLEEIIVVNGPGSFTGIRIGLTAAKTMAYTLNIPVKPISSLYAYLISSNINSDKACVIEDTKGYYISALDKDDNVIIEQQYVNNTNIINDIKQVNKTLNLYEIYNKRDNIKTIPTHSLKANYVKKIDVEKNE